jgi:type IV pilus assembly protein PilF
LDESKTTPDRSALVSVKQLSIPDSARREANNAQERLARNDVPGAVAALQRAVKIAPQFASAWNHLGTIAYQTADYKSAEQYFRKSLEAEPDAYEPLVNLGGVLLTLGQAPDAWSYNINAVLKRPHDALANSQLGMNYFEFGKLDLAEKYLKEARRLDPGHFSHPQLLLAEIAFRKGDLNAAAGYLEDFLDRHPDAPNAPKIRARVDSLRRSTP